MTKLYFISILYACLTFGQQNSLFAYPKNRLNPDSDTLIKNSPPIIFRIIDSTFIPEDNDIQKLKFTYLDSLGIERHIDMGKRNSLLTINAPVFLVESSRLKTPYYLHPGDQINVSLGPEKMLILQNKGSKEKNDELKFFLDLIDKTGLLLLVSTSFKIEGIEKIKAAESKIANIKEARYSFLDSMNRASPMNDKFLDLIKNTINNLALKDSLDLYWSNRDSLKGNSYFIEIMTEKLKSILHNTDYKNPYYLNCFDHIVNVLLKNIPTLKIKTFEEFKKHFDFIENYFSGTIKDYLQFRNFNLGYSYNVQITPEYLRKLNQSCKNPDYIKTINRQFNQRKVVFSHRNANNLLSANENQVIELKKVIKNKSGDLIFIDFWASWCQPCREQMPTMHDLENKYSDKKIQFLYISLDKDVINWKIANESENILPINSFILLNFIESPFVKQNKIEEIPRYILLGKHGEILVADLPEPNDPKLLSIIDRFLK